MLIMVKKMEQITENIIAYIHTDYNEKFGIPRQSGLAPSVQGRIVFQPEFRDPEAVRGLEGFSHIWLIWGFSQSKSMDWSPTIRPPRLGGTKSVGVFASRSPFRPNPLALSVARIVSIAEDTKEGPVIIISGTDLMDGTPIYDIKPYVPYSDSIPDALDGFATPDMKHLDVVISEEIRKRIPEEKLEALIGILSLDPRPAYQHDPGRTYGFVFAGMEIRFHVENETTVVVSEVMPAKA